MHYYRKSVHLATFIEIIYIIIIYTIFWPNDHFHEILFGLIPKTVIGMIEINFQLSNLKLSINLQSLTKSKRESTTPRATLDGHALASGFSSSKTRPQSTRISPGIRQNFKTTE